MLTRRGQLAWIFMCVIIISLITAAFFIFVSFRNNSDKRSESFASVASESLYAKRYAEQALQVIVARSIKETPALFLRADYPSPFRGLKQSFPFVFKKRFLELMNEYDPGDGRYGTLFALARNNQYVFTNNSDYSYTLIFPNVEQFIRSPDGSHQITRTFTLEVRFNQSNLL